MELILQLSSVFKQQSSCYYDQSTLTQRMAMVGHHSGGQRLENKKKTTALLINASANVDDKDYEGDSFLCGALGVRISESSYKDFICLECIGSYQWPERSGNSNKIVFYFEIFLSLRMRLCILVVDTFLNVQPLHFYLVISVSLRMQFCMFVTDILSLIKSLPKQSHLGLHWQEPVG